MYDVKILKENWQLFSSQNLIDNGDKISSDKFDPVKGYKISVPTTVLNALVKNNVYKDIFYGDNFDKISTDQFNNSWWYRTEFVIDEFIEDQFYTLEFDGINYRADIWLNGIQVSEKESIYGGFRIFKIDVTSVIKAGKNILVVKVFPPKPAEPTIGFVDWNPTPPDKNMGIWRDVKLVVNGIVSINHPFVKTDVETENLNEADLEICVNLKNHSDNNINGILKGKIGKISFIKNVSLNGKETKKIIIRKEEFPDLKIYDPELWWPHNFGKPKLHNLKLSFEIEDQLTDVKKVNFGIRKIEEYHTSEGHRGFKINGKDILIKGGGWVDDILLGDSNKKVEAQILYAKHLNLNTIRLEGFWGNSTHLYDLCDKHGIFLMPGWSCQWEWQNYFGSDKIEDEKYGCILTDHDIDLVATYMKEHILWLRNHPSIIIWGAGSDKLPHPKLEQKFLDIFKEFDDTRIYVNSHQEHTSELTGASAIKMRGPYDYVPPIYWYEDKENGGAFGFNSETSPGPQPPMLETIKKMIPEENLWPIDSIWNYHCGRNEFNDMDNYINALNNRYGKPNNLNDFFWKSQLMNYESIRPMFEAFLANKPKTTGIVQWMLNSAWPETYWQLYDYYLLPTAAFYGTKKAAAPINLVYDYHLKNIHIINDQLVPISGYKGEIKILTNNSETIYHKEIIINAKQNESVIVSHLSDFAVSSNLYFLDLRLFDNSNKLIATNFYWLSKKEDILDYSKVNWYVTPISDEQADFTELDSLPKVDLESMVSIQNMGEYWIVELELDNNSKFLSFFNYLSIKDIEADEEVKPIFWDDNFVSILPGESKRISGLFPNNNYTKDQLMFGIEGYNLGK